MSTATGRIMGKPSVKALRKRLSGRVADDSIRTGQAIVLGFIGEGVSWSFFHTRGLRVVERLRGLALIGRRRSISKKIVEYPRQHA
jgi:hypothetical protein